MNRIISKFTGENGMSRRRFFVNSAGIAAVASLPVATLATEVTDLDSSEAPTTNKNKHGVKKYMNTITTEDGEHLDAWWVPPPPGRGAVMFLHGTPGSLADTIWRLPDLQHSGFGVLAIDYRGYGASTGTPTEAGFAADARAAYDFIHNAVPEARIAIFGESLGTGIAVTLARERPIAGLLLNAPYASVRRLFETRAPPLPYRWLMKDPFDSEAKIGAVGVPVMILHGTADDAVPVEEARSLFAASHQPKTMIEVEGAGHLAAWEGGGAASALAALAAWTAPR